MTQIDFYILDSSDNDAEIRLACRLTEKAFSAGKNVYCHVTDEDQALKLSETLWSFRSDAFLPSEKIEASEVNEHSVVHAEKIAVGHTHPPENHHDILINLTGEIPPAFSRFDRVLELVPASHEARESSRRNFVYYRDHGYQWKKHEIASSKLA